MNRRQLKNKKLYQKIINEIKNILSEAEAPNDTSIFMSAIQSGKADDQLSFYVKNRIDLNPGSFCRDQEYLAKFVSNTTIVVQ
ncbi:hypothetical protein EBU94_07925, partial [bacterium]|nr:hypothetical protein [bacterium]